MSKVPNMVEVPTFLHPLGTERVITWHHIPIIARWQDVKISKYG